MTRIGTQIPLTEDERGRFVAALTFWRNHSKEYYRDRARFEDAFTCRWKNQHPSGTVRGRSEAKAWPFEGASDQCLRWGDTVVQELTSLLMNALRAAEVHVTCDGAGDTSRKARSLETLLKWSVNKMGARWESEMRALIHNYLVDSPAVAVMEVNWRTKSTLAVRTETLDQLAADFAQWFVNKGYGADLEASETWWAAVNEVRAGGPQESDDGMAPIGVSDVAYGFLVDAKGVDEDTARRILKAASVDADGEVEYLATAEKTETPEVNALRYGDDFCIPTLSEDWDYCSPWFRNEWVTEAQLREQIDEDGWSRKWVEETLKFPGQSVYDWEEPSPLDERNELYNVVWCYSVTTDAQGRAARWVSVLSAAEGSAFGKRVIRSRRGKWNAAFFRREVASRNLIDARGLAEIASYAQGVAKVIRDGAANNAIVGGLPPVKVKGTRIRNLMLEPMSKIPMGINDDVAFMQPPAFPAAADKQEEKIKAEFLAYAGVSDGKSDVSQRMRDMVGWFFAQVKDLYTIILEVTQDNISDELLAGVTDERETRGLKREDVTGNFGLRLVLDPNDLDNEKLMKKLQTLGQLILPLDKNSVIDTTPAAIEGMRLLLPGVAKESIKSPEEMTEGDLADEQRNFVQIKAGVMPKMNTDGKWNYAARLKWWQDMRANNPEAFADMSEASRALADKWIAALEQQQTQFGENAEIGRTGVEGVEG